MEEHLRSALYVFLSFLFLFLSDGRTEIHFKPFASYVVVKSSTKYTRTFCLKAKTTLKKKDAKYVTHALTFISSE